MISKNKDPKAKKISKNRNSHVKTTPNGASAPFGAASHFTIEDFDSMPFEWTLHPPLRCPPSTVREGYFYKTRFFGNEKAGLQLHCLILFFPLGRCCGDGLLGGPARLLPFGISRKARLQSDQSPKQVQRTDAKGGHTADKEHQLLNLRK